MELLYDERGHQYKVPIFCYAHPIELEKDSDTVGSTSIEHSSLVTTVGSGGSSKTSSPSSGALPIERLGGKQLNLRIKINPGDVNLQITASTADYVLQLKRAIATATSNESEVLSHTQTRLFPFHAVCLAELRRCA
jgi:hypothetical protein